MEKQFNKKKEFYAICDEQPKCFVVSSENVILTVSRKLLVDDGMTHGLIEREIESSCQIDRDLSYQHVNIRKIVGVI